MAPKSSPGNEVAATGPMVPPVPRQVPPSSVQCPAVKMWRLPEESSALTPSEQRAPAVVIALPPRSLQYGCGRSRTSLIRAAGTSAIVRFAMSRASGSDATTATMIRLLAGSSPQ